jgi:hypothetical protein
MSLRDSLRLLSACAEHASKRTASIFSSGIRLSRLAHPLAAAAISDPRHNGLRDDAGVFHELRADLCVGVVVTASATIAAVVDTLRSTLRRSERLHQGCAHLDRGGIPAPQWQSNYRQAAWPFIRCREQKDTHGNAHVTRKPTLASRLMLRQKWEKHVAVGLEIGLHQNVRPARAFQ